MFTGLVAHCGKITESKAIQSGRRFTIQCDFSDIQAGESIAVNGICLTAIDPKQHQFDVELSSETLTVTDAANYQIGSQVNLERALLASDRLGGHMVSGHVDDVASVILIEQQDEFSRLRFEPSDAAGLMYVVAKGSIAVNGVSLTINKVDDASFEVMLIPHTLEITNLSELALKQKVNIEYDMLAKIVAKQVSIQVEKVSVND